MNGSTEDRNTYPWLSGAAVIHVVCLAAITLAMTAWTHNLDDIKVLFFYMAGPVLALIGLGLMATGQAPVPGRLLSFGLIAYGFVLVISMLFSDYTRAGWQQFLFNWVTFGFFVSALAIGSSHTSSERLLRGIVVVLLVVNLIGFLMFDITGGGHSVVAIFFNAYWGDQAGDGSVYRLILTLARAQSDMQSTILSRDFYASVCLMFLPLAISLAIEPGRSRFPLVWRVIGFVASLTATLSIWLCFSKYQYPLWALCVIGFFLLVWTFGNKREITNSIAITLPMFALAILVILFRFGDVTRGTYISVRPLSTIWSGALGIFASHPILGSGPGTFDIYFPLYRDPNYSSYQISHVTANAHNIFLDVISETGLLGLAAYVAVLLGVLLPVARFRSAEDPLRGRMIAGLIAATVTILSVTFNPVGRWVIGAASMWTVLGLAAGWGLQAGGLEARSISSSRRGVFAVLAIALMLTPLCAMRGVQYFSAALPYAKGLSQMEPAMDAIETHQQIDYSEKMLLDSTLDLNQSTERDPMYYSPYYKLGSAWTTLSSIERDKAEAAQKEKRDGDAALHDSQADEYLKKAKDAYEKLAAMNPHYAQIHYNLAIVYNQYAMMLNRQFERAPQRTELKEQAAQYDRMALEQAALNAKMSHSANAYQAYGNLLLAANQATKACEILEKASDLRPEDENLANAFLQAAQSAKNQAAIAKANERSKKIKH